MEQKVEIKFLENDKFEVVAVSSGAKLYADSKKEDYNPSGPNPLELFLSSLGACIGVFAKKYLNRHNLEFKELKNMVFIFISHMFHKLRCHNLLLQSPAPT